MKWLIAWGVACFTALFVYGAIAGIDRNRRHLDDNLSDKFIREELRKLGVR